MTLHNQFKVNDDKIIKPSCLPNLHISRSSALPAAAVGMLVYGQPHVSCRSPSAVRITGTNFAQLKGNVTRKKADFE